VRALADTGALLALARRGDQYHAQATALADSWLAGGGRFIGTVQIMAELHSHLLYLRGAGPARTALRHLLADPAHEWFGVGPELVGEAVENWLDRYADQPSSLIDAVTFEIMRSFPDFAH
jgi:predicted nucleic acid-binding protein